jgi:DNA-binding CsgD family transcriptional regulator
MPELVTAPGNAESPEKDATQPCAHLTVSRGGWHSQDVAAQARPLQPAVTGICDRAVELLSTGVMAISSGRRLQFANGAAADLLLHGHWLRLTNGIVSAGTQVLERRALDAALSDACKRKGLKTLVCESRGKGEALIHIAAPTNSAAREEPPVYALVWLTKVMPDPTVVQDLTRIFNLTPAESRLLPTLMAGGHLREAASCMGISIHTARAQLKSILRKSNRRSQSQLLALALRIASLQTT